MAAEAVSTHDQRLRSAVSPFFEKAFLRRVKSDGPIISLFQWLQSIGAVPSTLGQLDANAGGGGEYAAKLNIETDTGNSVVNFSSGDPRPTGGTLTDYIAQHEWRGLMGNVHMRGDLFRAGTAGAMWNNAGAWDSKMQSLLDDIIDKLDLQLIGAGGSGAIDGLDAIFNDTNTYATIDRTSVANWKPYKKDASSAAISKTLLDDVHLVLTETRRVGYDCILVGSTQFQKLEDILDGRRRDATDIAPTSITYRGRPIYEIAGLTNDRAYFVKKRNFALPFQGWQDGVLNGALQQAATMKMLPFGMIAEDDKSDGASLSMGIFTNLVYRNTWESAYLDGLAT